MLLDFIAQLPQPGLPRCVLQLSISMHSDKPQVDLYAMTHRISHLGKIQCNCLWTNILTPAVFNIAVVLLKQLGTCLSPHQAIFGSSLCLVSTRTTGDQFTYLLQAWFAFCVPFVSMAFDVGLLVAAHALVLSCHNFLLFV